MAVVVACLPIVVATLGIEAAAVGARIGGAGAKADEQHEQWAHGSLEWAMDCLGSARRVPHAAATAESPEARGLNARISTESSRSHDQRLGHTLAAAHPYAAGS